MITEDRRRDEADDRASARGAADFESTALSGKIRELMPHAGPRQEYAAWPDAVCGPAQGQAQFQAAVGAMLNKMIPVQPRSTE